MMEATLILTAELDDGSFAWLHGLRSQHFPSHLNFLSAHLTLFHRLSSAQAARLRFLEPRFSLTLRFDHIVFLGFGVAMHVESIELERLRNEIRAAIGGEFSRQDSQPWTPHVTIQNKVSPERARELQRTLEAGFLERAGAVTGLLIWEYLAGPWKLIERIAFEGG